MKEIGPGELWCQLVLQNPTTPEAVDSFGQPVGGFTPVGAFSASIRPLDGREATVAKQIKAEASHVITMWYLGPTVSITPLSQFIYTDPTLSPSNPRTFGVVSVINIKERNWWYKIVAHEIQQTGPV